MFEVSVAPSPLILRAIQYVLYAKIGQLNMELDCLKKSQGSVFKRKTELDDPVMTALVRSVITGMPIHRLR